MSETETETTSDAPDALDTVEIGSQTIRLRAPTDIVVAWECLALQSPIRAGAMALYLCWPDDVRGRPRVSYAKVGHSPSNFAHAIFTEWSAHVDPADLVIAGVRALRFLRSHLPTGQQIAEARGFSRPGTRVD
jgi:hypothetical protein